MRANSKKSSMPSSPRVDAAQQLAFRGCDINALSVWAARQGRTLVSLLPAIQPQASNPAQEKPKGNGHGTRSVPRAERAKQLALFDREQIPCWVCGHVRCGHTSADRRYYRALRRRMLPCRRVSIAPTLSEAAWDSYSADRIGKGQPIRKPFLFEGKPYCNTGGTRQEFEGYLVVERRQFHERMFRYDDPAGFKRTVYYDPRLKEHFEGDQQRHAPKGYYHGMRVKRGGKEYVLAGPPVEFVVGALSRK